MSLPDVRPEHRDFHDFPTSVSVPSSFCPPQLVEKSQWAQGWKSCTFLRPGRRVSRLQIHRKTGNCFQMMFGDVGVPTKNIKKLCCV